MTDSEIDKAVVDFRPLADWWASRIQWSEEDHEDLVQEGLYWLFRTLKGYQKSGRPIQDLSSLANSCLSPAMKWYYKKKDREDREVARLDNLQVPIEGENEYFSEIFTKEYIAEVGRVLGETARVIVENLLTPSAAVIQVAMCEMSAKAERCKNGERVVGHSTLRVTKEHIRKVSNITEGQWQSEWSKIRKFTAKYCGIPLPEKKRNGAGKSGASPLSLAS